MSVILLKWWWTWKQTWKHWYISWSSGGQVSMQEWVLYHTRKQVCTWFRIFRNSIISRFLNGQSIKSAKGLVVTGSSVWFYIFNDTNFLHFYTDKKLVLIIFGRCDGIPDCGDIQVKNWYSFFNKIQRIDVLLHIFSGRSLLSIGASRRLSCKICSKFWYHVKGLFTIFQSFKSSELDNFGTIQDNFGTTFGQLWEYVEAPLSQLFRHFCENLDHLVTTNDLR